MTERGIDLNGKTRKLWTPNSSIKRDWVFEEKKKMREKEKKGN
jgi:ribosomal protein L28